MPLLCFGDQRGIDMSREGLVEEPVVAMALDDPVEAGRRRAEIPRTRRHAVGNRQKRPLRGKERTWRRDDREGLSRS